MNDLPVRNDLLESHERAWAAIAAPGTWLDGARRVAVAAEVRKARDCAHCARIKAALSPYGVPGAHESLGKLGAAEIELIHRVVGDPGRLSEKWFQSVLALGLSEGEYVEIVGLVSMVMILDTCLRALGLPERPLPAPKTGAPKRHRPANAKKKAAWLPTIGPGDGEEEGYIYRSLSLVPQSMRDYWALADCHYMPGKWIYQFDKSIRAIPRPQIEVIAARVSALHLCAY